MLWFTFQRHSWHSVVSPSDIDTTTFVFGGICPVVVVVVVVVVIRVVGVVVVVVLVGGGSRSTTR